MLSGSTGGTKGAVIGGRNLPRILGPKTVFPHISNELKAGIENSYEFHPLHGGRTAIGFEATLLPMMCETIIDASKAGDLKNEEAVKTAEILLRGFARIGIIALVDEATGFQELRDREALQKILDKYLLKEFAAWSGRLDKCDPRMIGLRITRITGFAFLNQESTKLVVFRGNL